jgi:hypothetical protein
MADVRVPGFRKYWTQKLASLKTECHAITNKYPEAASVVQQVYKMFSDIENFAGCTLTEVVESSEWTSIVNSMEENKANFRDDLDGKPLFSTLYGMYAVTLNELKAVLKVSAKAGQNDVVDKTSMDPMAQDNDFQEVEVEEVRGISLIIPYSEEVD